MSYQHVLFCSYLAGFILFIFVSENVTCSETLTHSKQKSSGRPANNRPTNVPDCLASGKCKFWGKQFDCSMCPGANRKQLINDEINQQKIVNKKCEHDKSSLSKEVQNLISSKSLMIQELKEALSNMVDENLLSIKQKRALLDRLGMKSSDDSDKNDKYKGIGFEHIVSISSIYSSNDIRIKKDKSDDNILKFESNDIDQPIHPSLNLGNDFIVHKFLIQRHKRLKRKLKKVSTRKRKKLQHDSLKLVLKEQQVELYAMYRRHMRYKNRRGGKKQR
eukprot:g7700.t1